MQTTELSKTHHQDGQLGVSGDICRLDYIDSQACEIISPVEASRRNRKEYSQSSLSGILVAFELFERMRWMNG